MGINLSPILTLQTKTMNPYGLLQRKLREIFKPMSLEFPKLAPFLLEHLHTIANQPSIINNTDLLRVNPLFSPLEGRS
jgi:hypothetical protein